MTTTYKVEISHLGTTQTIEVREDQTILQAAYDAGIDLPSSCNAGVCTTCAAQLSQGSVEQGEGMGLCDGQTTWGNGGERHPSHPLPIGNLI